MNLRELLHQLEDLPENAPLLFETAEGPIGDGYHVTELKKADVASIDCGGVESSFTETRLQLLDGKGRGAMPVGKFRKILTHSMDRIEGLGDHPTHIEFAPQNKGLGLYPLTEVRAEEDAVYIPLEQGAAQCKPRARALAKLNVANAAQGCCGGNQARRCC